ncbi:putative transcription antitermination regulator [Nocardia nova SH22a]|uniref:histidine kinase n=1 Tax=Nocardia nova SH22a TaxID=1415166 RepID=W5TCV6_9NOCA|nr:PAS and ANTAR domain-containing protein [Nocardia nova]AHH16798.1 putative transcription antitermination regulator [Nocardia nova SH22a]
MSTEPRPAAAELDLVTTVLGAEPCGGVGWFRFWFADQRWEWSEEVARMYGYPADTEPSTDLLLSHKHPDDRERMADSIATALETGDPICGQHRIVDSDGQSRDIIVVGDHLADDAGTIIGTCGFFVDITETIAGERNEAISEVLPDLIEARAVIEQAKGALVLAYGISPDQAFRVLSWRSQETNTKLRDLAVQFVDEFRRLKGQHTATRSRVDHIVLTAHRLVPRD